MIKFNLIPLQQPPTSYAINFTMKNLYTVVLLEEILNTPFYFEMRPLYSPI